MRLFLSSVISGRQRGRRGVFRGSSSPASSGTGGVRNSVFSRLSGGHGLSALQGLPDIFRTTTMTIPPTKPMASKTPTMIPTSVTVAKPPFSMVVSVSSPAFSMDRLVAAFGVVGFWLSSWAGTVLGGVE